MSSANVFRLDSRPLAASDDFNLPQTLADDTWTKPVTTSVRDSPPAPTRDNNCKRHLDGCAGTSSSSDNVEDEDLSFFHLRPHTPQGSSSYELKRVGRMLLSELGKQQAQHEENIEALLRDHAAEINCKLDDLEIKPPWGSGEGGGVVGSPRPHGSPRPVDRSSSAHFALSPHNKKMQDLMTRQVSRVSFGAEGRVALGNLGFKNNSGSTLGMGQQPTSKSNSLQVGQQTTVTSGGSRGSKGPTKCGSAETKAGLQVQWADSVAIPRVSTESDASVEVVKPIEPIKSMLKLKSLRFPWSSSPRTEAAEPPEEVHKTDPEDPTKLLFLPSEVPPSGETGKHGQMTSEGVLKSGLSKREDLDVSVYKSTRASEAGHPGTFEEQMGKWASFGWGGTSSAYLQASDVDIKNQPRGRQLLTKCVQGRRFELVVCVMLMLNTLFIGAEADYDMNHPREVAEPLLLFYVMNIIFTVFFSVEWALRVCTETWRFFHYRNPKVWWNVFDTLLVITAIAEEVMLRFGGSGTNVSSVRVLRTLRVVRGFRIIRVFAFFRDLRVMVAGIAQSVYSLFWALLLLVCIMFLFSVCVLQFAIGEHVAQTTKDESMISLDDTDYKDLMEYYNSLLRTIYTLYSSIVGGIDWADAAKPLIKLNSGLGLLFTAYIAFSVLCVLNIITGVFVENANRQGSANKEEELLEQARIRREWLVEVKELFESADADASGELDGQEFTAQLLSDWRLQAWFRKIGVQVETYSAHHLFELLDVNDDGKLDLGEFAAALQQVHGTARAIDLAKVGRDIRKTRSQLSDLMEMCCDFFTNGYDSSRETGATWQQTGKPADRLGLTADERTLF